LFLQWQFFKRNARNKSAINTASSSPNQHYLAEPPSIGWEHGGRKIAKYKGEVLLFISSEEVAQEG
jgi:hypothetical protein